MILVLSRDSFNVVHPLVTMAGRLVHVNICLEVAARVWGPASAPPCVLVLHRQPFAAGAVSLNPVLPRGLVIGARQREDVTGPHEPTLDLGAEPGSADPGAGRITSSRKRPIIFRSAISPVVMIGFASGVGRSVMSTSHVPARRASDSASGPCSCIRAIADWSGLWPALCGNASAGVNALSTPAIARSCTSLSCSARRGVAPETVGRPPVA